MKLTQEEFDSVEWRDGFQQALCFSFRDTTRRVKALVCLVTLLCIGAAAAFAQEPQPDQSTNSLAKQAQNPVAHMISVPFQNNFNFGAGAKSDFQNVLNIQPVVPFRLSERWTLITRTIIPVVRQPVYGHGLDEKFGLGDVQMSFFLSPAKAGKVLWGVGPIVQLPSATGKVLGTGKLSVGPSAVVLTTRGPWVLGTLFNNPISVAGKGDRKKVNQMLIQPFVNYNMKKGWYLVSSPFITADWKRAANDRWTVPIGGGVGRILRLGKQPVNIQAQAFYNVTHPDRAAKWSLRLQFQLLFPHKPTRGK
jgi:hypothetical protein